MAKIAVELERALARRAAYGAPGQATPRELARGEGWAVADVLCTAGPHDRPFEEQHTDIRIAIVAAGSFQYRTTAGREMMTPGSLLLGATGGCYECGHEHGTGDRCLSFGYTPDYFERLAADAGVGSSAAMFRTGRLPPLPALSLPISQALAGLQGDATASWEEIGVHLAVHTLQQLEKTPSVMSAPSPEALARVTAAVRRIERDPGGDYSLSALAQEAALSSYHFLRTFERVTGVTPHQYVLRVRLREAALRLATEQDRVTDIAFGCGFGDVSNFNHAFRAEFGLSPRAYRQRTQRKTRNAPV